MLLLASAQYPVLSLPLSLILSLLLPLPLFFSVSLLSVTLSLHPHPGCLGNQWLLKEPRCSHIPYNKKSSDNAQGTSKFLLTCLMCVALEAPVHVWGQVHAQPSSAYAMEHYLSGFLRFKICEHLGSARVCGQACFIECIISITLFCQWPLLESLKTLCSLK